MMAGMSWRDYLEALVEYLRNRNKKPTPSPAPEPAPSPAPPPIPPAPDPKIVQTTWEKIIHHYNPKSFAEGAYAQTGQGVSIIFCVGDHYDSVIFDNENLRCHNRNDEGRDVWTNVNFIKKQRTFVSGEVFAVKKGVTYKFTIPPGGRSYLDYKGNCFGKR